MADGVLEHFRIELKDGLTGIVIKQLLDELKKERVLNGEEAESIDEQNPTRAEKARKLIDSVTKKGARASEIMFEKIKVADENLYNKLKLDDFLNTPAAEASDHSFPWVVRKKEARGPKTPDDNDQYPMTSTPRGFCLIISNAEFKDPEDNLTGYVKDADALGKVFMFLGFTVDIHKNLTAWQMKNLILAYSNKKKYGDCFVCCVLSHGSEKGVFGTDFVLCPLKDIFSPFDGENCPPLVGKPKVFFIQACRGGERHEKVWVKGAGPSLMASDAQKPYTITKQSDFLVSMSTVEDYVSYVNECGSWFIQSLCKYLREGSQRGDDILAILTKVNNDVTRREGRTLVNNTEVDAKMTPEPRFTLTKKLIFRIP